MREKLENPLLIASSYTDFASVYAQDSNTCDKGIQYFTNALLIYQKEKGSVGLQGSYYDYASILFKKNDTERFPIILNSLITYTSTLTIEERHRAMAYNLQSESFIRNGKLNEAEELLLKSIVINKNEGQRDLLE
jgi:tetratricopeptide (TPR) repeat protein